MNLSDVYIRKGFSAKNTADKVDSIYPVKNVMLRMKDTSGTFAGYNSGFGNTPVLICDTNKNWSVNPDVGILYFWANNTGIQVPLEGATVVSHDESHSDLCGVFFDVENKVFHIGRFDNMSEIATTNFYFFGGITANNKFTKLSDCLLPIAYRGRMISHGGVLQFEWATEGNGILFDGDSITYGVMDSLHGNPRAEVTYPRICSALLGYTYDEDVNNIAVSGCCIAKKTSGTTHMNDSMVQRSDTNNYSPYKVIILGGGTNDWSNGTPLGDYDSDDITTVFGAYNHILSRIYHDNKYARVFIWTPMQRFLRGGAYMNPYTLEVNGLTIKDFSKEIEEYCLYKGINCINMFEKGFITAFNRVNPNICADGLHPGQLGYEMLANKIANFVKANMY